MRPTHAGVMFACLLALAPAPAAGQATMVPPEYCAYDLNGRPLVGGTLTSYAAGTTTPLALYTDFGLTTPHSNPLTLDGRGCVIAYMQPSTYRFVLRDSGGTQIYDATIVSSPALHTVNVDISATAGETLAAGTVVFLADGSDSTTAGRWHLTDADTVSKSIGARIVGITLAAIANGATGTVRVLGRVTGLSGLTAGAPYYVSATAGSVAASPPTNRRFVGEAESSSVLVLAAGLLEAAAPTLLSLSVAGATTLSSTLTVSSTITERGRSTPIGEWINVSYDAAAFTSDGSADSWDVESGDVGNDRYILVGKTMWWSLRIATSTVTTLSSPTELRATIPGGYTAASTTSVAVAFYSEASTASAALAEAVAGTTYVRVAKTGAALSNTTDTTYVYFLIPIEIQ